MAESLPGLHDRDTKVDLSGELDTSKLSGGNNTAGFGEEQMKSFFGEAMKRVQGVTIIRNWLPTRSTGGSATVGGVQSWREFVRTDKFHVPTGPAIATRRVVSNLNHFQSNYMCIFIVLAVYCVLTSPILLIALGTSAGLIYYVRGRQSVAFAGRQLPPSYAYAAIAVLSFPLFYLAGAGSAVFWVIGASVFFIVLHAVFYAGEPDPVAEFQMEDV